MALDEIQIGGLGARRKRVEDARFIRGKGNYIDDFKLPGMLHMETLRSPIAHARITSIDTSKAWMTPGVHMVITGDMAAQHNLAWMPTLSYDTQAVLATDKVRFQGQEICCVVADDPYIAKDACEVIVVEYDPLPPIVSPKQALAPGAPIIRDDKAGQTNNICYTWEVGDKENTERVFADESLQIVSQDIFYPRTHPCPIENMAIISDYNSATGKLTIYLTTQAPHIIRTAVALVAELPEHMIRVIAPDLGGGFVKWIEDKTGNLISTGYARDMYFHCDAAIRKDGKIQAVRVHADTDNGGFFSDAQPTKFKIGLFHSIFGCYDVPYGYLTAQGHYTNKAPGGVAYRCSFRITESMFFQERFMQTCAYELGMDQADFRRVNFIREFPHRTTFGFLVDSGDYDKCLDLALEKIDYYGFKERQKAARQQGRLLGLGLSCMSEPLGAGNSREYDIIGIKMFDSAELRVHPSGKAVLKIGSKTQGQGHETTFAQIVTHELGIPADDILVQHGDTDNTPFGMGTYASRSTPTAGAATAMVARKVRAKAKKLAAHLLEVSEEDVEWELGRFYVRSAPNRGVTITDCAFAAYTNMPDGLEPGLENNAYYDPPNMTWPFDVYITGVLLPRPVKTP
jgi:carbon-monoxide dehydrogenase large subunit